MFMGQYSGSFQQAHIRCDREAVLSDPQYPPEIDTLPEGVGTAIMRWHMRLGDTYAAVLLPLDANHAFSKSVVLYVAREFGTDPEWHVLYLLRDLPDCFHVYQPIHIDNRHLNGSTVLVRPNSLGYSDVVYRCDSDREARKLLEYISNDPWNFDCAIEHIASGQVWSVFRAVPGGSVVLASYPEKYIALKVACDMSARYGEQPLYVAPEQLPGPRDLHVVVQGKVRSVRKT